jgi:hypothetical protein
LGNGRAVPEGLRRPDVLVVVYGGDGDRANFLGRKELRNRLMGQVFGQPLLVMLNLDLDHRSVCIEEEGEMEDELDAFAVTQDLLLGVGQYRESWVRYNRKFRPPDW